jgi:DNA-binding transcriptional ArsR family regulator
VLPAEFAVGVSRVEEDPARVWAALAPHLAGQPRVRLSRDGGKSYPQKHERNLTEALPTVPAAVRIFGKDGTCSAIFLDFDTSVAGPDWVDADVRAAQTYLHSCGARWIEDFSPNGGRHLYVPLAERVTFTEARDFVEALGSRLRTLDKTPHQNLLHGCMRTPGSPHKRGGNAADVWAKMTDELSDEIAAARAYRLDQSFTPTFDEPAEPDVSKAGRMSRAMQRIAATGIYDTSRYATDSDARQAVLTGAAAGGLDLTDVDRRMKQGIWPGLASFYARYPSRHRAKALLRDWKKASTFIKQKRVPNEEKNNARKSTTSQPESQAGYLQGSSISFSNPENEHRFIRTWRNALQLSEGRYRDSREGLARRMVLRAMGEAAHKTASRFVEFGVRSLAVATGLDHSTVVSHLQALRKEPDPLITLVETGRGTRGDQYMLTIPEQVKDQAEDAAWKPGRIHALRPAFRELGLPAAFVYETVESSPTPLSSAEIVRATRLSRTAVGEALDVLAAWNLVGRGNDRRWFMVSATSLRVLAEQLGVLEAVAAQIQRYKAERVRWREWLATHTITELLIPQPDEDYPWEKFEGPPDEWTLADMAFR